MAFFLTLMLSGGGPVDEGLALEGLLADAAGAAAPGCDSAAMLLCPVAAIRSASASPPLLVWGRALRVGHALFDGTLGFPGEGPQPKQLLRIATLNVTSWTSWKEVAGMEAAGADVWLFQEHRLMSVDEIARARSYMQRLGLTAIFSPAVATELGGRSSGTGIAFSLHAELIEEMRVPVQTRHRATGARVRVRGLELQL